MAYVAVGVGVVIGLMVGIALGVYWGVHWGAQAVSDKGLEFLNPLLENYRKLRDLHKKEVDFYKRRLDQEEELRSLNFQLIEHTDTIKN